jgi:hypothetical protein
MRVNKIVLLIYLLALQEPGYCSYFSCQLDTSKPCNENSLLSTIENLNQLISGYKENIKLKDNNISKLESENNILNNKIEFLQTKEKAQASSIEKQQEEILGLKSQLEKSMLKKIIKDCNDSLLVVNSDLKSKNIEINDRDTKLNLCYHKVDSLEALGKQLAYYISKKDELQIKYQQCLSDKEVLNVKFGQNAGEIKTLNEKLENYKGIEKKNINDLSIICSEILNGPVVLYNDFKILDLENKINDMLFYIPNNEQLVEMKSKLEILKNDCLIIAYAKETLNKPFDYGSINNSINSLGNVKSTNHNLIAESKKLSNYLNAYCKKYKLVYKYLIGIDDLGLQQNREEDLASARKLIDQSYYIYLSTAINEKAKNIMKNGNIMPKIGDCN